MKSKNDNIKNLLFLIEDFVKNPTDDLFSQLRESNALAYIATIATIVKSNESLNRYLRSKTFSASSQWSDGAAEKIAESEEIWWKLMKKICNSVKDGDISMTLLYATQLQAAMASENMTPNNRRDR
jgi:hypothetical protein